MPDNYVYRLKTSNILRNMMKFQPTKKGCKKAYENPVKNTFIDFRPKRFSIMYCRNSSSIII